MTARVGIDVLDRRELARLITRPWFVRYCFAPEEIKRADRLGPARRLEFLTGRFAAKEAVLKLLGKGLLQGVPPRDICIDRAPSGAPAIRLVGRAVELRTSPVAVSITHKENVAAAVAVSPAPTPATRADRKEADIMSAEHDDVTDVQASLRLRIGQEDAHYGGGLVDGARLLKLFGDLVTEITIRTDGDEGLLSEISDARFTAPVAPGDYIEATGRLVRSTRLRRVVELQAHKVIAAQPRSGSTVAELLDPPQLVCSATATTVVPRQPNGGRA